MKRRTIIQPAEEAAADTRRERLLDEALQAMAQPAPVDLKARVMAAIAEAGPGRAAESEPASRRAWRPALAFAAAAAVVLVMLAALWPTGTPAPRQQTAGTPAAARQAAPLQARAGTPSSSTPTAAARPAGPAAPRQQRGPRQARAQLQRPAAVQASAAVEEAAAGPYLPGAPAGDLGDPLAPLPRPPAIGFAPITQAPISSAPPVSDIARPVTDFPADTASSDAPARAAGQSGGTRR